MQPPGTRSRNRSNSCSPTVVPVGLLGVADLGYLGQVMALVNQRDGHRLGVAHSGKDRIGLVGPPGEHQRAARVDGGLDQLLKRRDRTGRGDHGACRQGEVRFEVGRQRPGHDVGVPVQGPAA